MKGFPPKRYSANIAKGYDLRGFTIIELLIVVVVIAILAAITIVAYNGITTQAQDAALKNDLTTGVKQLHMDKVDNGTFPGSKPNYLGSTIQYTGGGDSFCITASKGGRALHMTQNGTIQSGACSGHTIGGGGGDEITANSPIQNVTSAQCQALPTFTGSNNEAVRTVTDNRGGTTRTYEIAKLADGNCWMLTNLKLGSTSGSITLTPADSDVASSFTLPQVTTGGAGEYDLPRTYGPVPSDTGSGSTNYGYLYNWSAITAGETTSLTTGNAPHSICPASWRLPTDGSQSSDFGQLDVAFGGTGNGASNGEVNIARWNYSGAFRGVLSGGWYSLFYDQGAAGEFWSASTSPDWPESSSYTYFSPDDLDPGVDDLRSSGRAVRCLLTSDGSV